MSKNDLERQLVEAVKRADDIYAAQEGARLVVHRSIDAIWRARHKLTIQWLYQTVARPPVTPGYVQRWFNYPTEAAEHGWRTAKNEAGKSIKAHNATLMEIAA